MRYGNGVGLVIAAALLWSLQGLIFRQIDTAEPWAILFWRSLGMIPVIALFILWQKGQHGLRGLWDVGFAGIIGAFGLIFAFGGAIYAIQSTTIANAVFLFSASPFITALLGWAVLGEKVRRRSWVSIGVAAIGIAVMVQGGLDRGALPGNLAALSSAAGFSVFTVTLRRSATSAMPIVLLGGIFSLIAGAGGAWVSLTPLVVPLADVIWSTGMGAVTLAGGMVLYSLGSRVVPAAELTLISLLEVMLAPLLVWLVIGETASHATMLGGIFVLGAVLLNTTGRTRHAPALV
ncbi:DMT family transporter [Roseicyclus sp.]|uniref:DMT family transporter n=1 Tax=Roseicyclus sp. TaxID=1914329 RepID=UPI003F6ADD19